jgi:predicted transcriptional regulator
MDITQLAISYYYSKKNLEGQELELFRLHRELEALEKGHQSVEAKINILALKSQIESQNDAVENRQEELSSFEKELLEALIKGNFKVDEIIEINVNDNSHIKVSRSDENTILCLGPFSRL